jgi:protein-S-isoprenylcysteine O-methyltransferase Ste14
VSTLDLGSRKLDFLWVALSIGLALFTWTYAVREDYSPIWLYISMDIQCAVLFAIRYRAQSTQCALEIFVTVLSLNYYFAFQPVPMSSKALATIGGIISGIGAVLAIVSLYSLGRSFAILPAVRPIQISGMYQLVRHPIYVSYMLMALGTVVRHMTAYNAGVALVGLGLMGCRIAFEERLLKQDPLYRDYMNVVRYRLIPGVY